MAIDSSIKKFLSASAYFGIKWVFKTFLQKLLHHKLQGERADAIAQSLVHLGVGVALKLVEPVETSLFYVNTT
jgi:hypothetical protein